jgi:hypothetical protein
VGSVEHESPINGQATDEGAIKDTTKTAVALGVLAILLVSIAGCTSTTNQLTSGQALQVRDYADAFHNRVEAHLGPKETITTRNDTSNGTNAMRLQWTVDNSTRNTSNLFGQNGTTTSYSVNIQQFSSKEEATTFYNDVRVGYTTVSNASTPIKPEDNIYKQVTGHDPSVTNAAWKLDSVTPVTVQFSFIVQQDEFVTWGSASVLTK